MNAGALPTGRAHLAAVREALARFDAETERLDRWGAHAATVLAAGGRLLAAGNGGSAAEAQHLTALALHAETSSLTAIGNDYGSAEAFARQVRAHGRRGDLLVLLSTSGRSPNILAAAEAGRDLGLRVWALTGPAPNPLADRCDDAVCVNAREVPTIQEVHLVAVHLLCAAIDVAVRAHLLEGVRLEGITI